MIRSMSDILQAIDEGRFHNQGFIKSASLVGDTHWLDWSYASGQPGYDARVGDRGQFNPFVAVGNNAIWFPGISNDHERRLMGITFRTGPSDTNQNTLDAVLYDLLGIYPLINGDTTDEQVFINNDPLPRYSTGEGVIPVMVNHIAPQLNNADGVMNYTSCSGESKSVSIYINNPTYLTYPALTKIVSTMGISGTVGPLSLNMAAGCRGVRSVQSIQWTTPPGGLHCLYLIKPIATIMNNDGRGTTEKIATEKCLCIQNGFNLPRIYDGAHLGFFFRPNGNARATTIFGNLTFIWG